MTTWIKNGQRGKHLGEEGRRADVWFPKSFYSNGRRSATTVMLDKDTCQVQKLLQLKNRRLNIYSLSDASINKQLMSKPLKGSRTRQPASVVKHRGSQTTLNCYLWIIFLYQSCCDACYCEENSTGTNSSTQFIQPRASTSIKSESKPWALPHLNTISFRTLDIRQGEWGAVLSRQ